MALGNKTITLGGTHLGSQVEHNLTQGGDVEEAVFPDVKPQFFTGEHYGGRLHEPNLLTAIQAAYESLLESTDSLSTPDDLEIWFRSDAIRIPCQALGIEEASAGNLLAVLDSFHSENRPGSDTGDIPRWVRLQREAISDTIKTFRSLLYEATEAANTPSPMQRLQDKARHDYRGRLTPQGLQLMLRQELLRELSTLMLLNSDVGFMRSRLAKGNEFEQAAILVDAQTFAAHTRPDGRFRAVGEETDYCPVECSPDSSARATLAEKQDRARKQLGKILSQHIIAKTLERTDSIDSKRISYPLFMPFFHLGADSAAEIIRVLEALEPPHIALDCLQMAITGCFDPTHVGSDTDRYHFKSAPWESAQPEVVAQVGEKIVSLANGVPRRRRKGHSGWNHLLEKSRKALRALPDPASSYAERVGKPWLGPNDIAPENQTPIASQRHFLDSELSAGLHHGGCLNEEQMLIELEHGLRFLLSRVRKLQSPDDLLDRFVAVDLDTLLAVDTRIVRGDLRGHISHVLDPLLDMVGPRDIVELPTLSRDRQAIFNALERLKRFYVWNNSYSSGDEVAQALRNSTNPGQRPLEALLQRAPVHWKSRVQLILWDSLAEIMTCTGNYGSFQWNMSSPYADPTEVSMALKLAIRCADESGRTSSDEGNERKAHRVARRKELGVIFADHALRLRKQSTQSGSENNPPHRGDLHPDPYKVFAHLGWDAIDSVCHTFAMLQSSKYSHADIRRAIIQTFPDGAANHSWHPVPEVNLTKAQELAEILVDIAHDNRKRPSGSDNRWDNIRAVRDSAKRAIKRFPKPVHRIAKKINTAY